MKILGVIILVIVVVWYVLHRSGNPAFWKAVRENLELAIDWFESESCWIIVRSGNLAPSSDDYTLGFPVRDPHTKQIVKVYCLRDQIDDSQNRFLQHLNLRSQEIPKEIIKNVDNEAVRLKSTDMFVAFEEVEDALRIGKLVNEQDLRELYNRSSQRINEVLEKNSYLALSEDHGDSFYYEKILWLAILLEDHDAYARAVFIIDSVNYIAHQAQGWTRSRGAEPPASGDYLAENFKVEFLALAPTDDFRNILKRKIEKATASA